MRTPRNCGRHPEGHWISYYVTGDRLVSFWDASCTMYTDVFVSVWEGPDL